ncbi:uncharacterized protein LOC111946458 isoform X3 [Oryzias latipes]
MRIPAVDVMSCPPVIELLDLWPALKIESEEIQDIHTKRTTVLHALPVYLHEDVSGDFKTCTDESDEPELDGVAVGLLTVSNDHHTSPVHYEPVEISVVIESDEVVSLPRFCDAFVSRGRPALTIRKGRKKGRSRCQVRLLTLRLHNHQPAPKTTPQ